MFQPNLQASDFHNPSGSMEVPTKTSKKTLPATATPPETRTQPEHSQPTSRTFRPSSGVCKHIFSMFRKPSSALTGIHSQAWHQRCLPDRIHGLFDETSAIFSSRPPATIEANDFLPSWLGFVARHECSKLYQLCIKCLPKPSCLMVLWLKHIKTALF